MFTAFDEIESQGIGELQGVFGSAFTFIPMKTRPNKRPVRDRSREAFDICGILNIKSLQSDMDKNTRIDRAGGKRSMSFNNVSLKEVNLNVRNCDLLWVPQQFDAVIRAADGQVYEVMNLFPTGFSDLDIKLNEVEGPYGINS